MFYRAWKANRVAKARQGTWKPDSIEHIGFVLISLFEGFIIVTVLNAGGPWWLVAILAVSGLVFGRWAIGQAKRRTTAILS